MKQYKKIQEALTSLEFQWVHYQYKNIQGSFTHFTEEPGT